MYMRFSPSFGIKRRNFALFMKVLSVFLALSSTASYADIGSPP